MEYVFEERIGDPDLFTGRKEELAFYLNWIEEIKERKSQSTAILAHRKMGKTALMERLFNITFYKNAGVIPFYYEVKEVEMWVGDFCVDFFLTFVYQYIAFKTRNAAYLKPLEKNDFGAIKDIARKEGLDDIALLVKSVEYSYTRENIGILWNTVREAPKTMAAREKEFIVQMIDEFQFMNSMIYWDKERNKVADTLAGGYLSSAESKIAPLLVSGSWVGWLMNMLIMKLPARFRFIFFNNMPEHEAVETVFKYARAFQVPVSEETVYLISGLTEGNPFYISALFRSAHPDKDLTTLAGLTRTLEFETLNPQGGIKTAWMEYVRAAFDQINGRNAKRIVLHLFKHKDRVFTRKELLDDLKLDMTDEVLEEKLEALVKADIIAQGQTNFDYRCVPDNIFDKVFRGVYQKEIEHFDAGEITKEYRESSEKLKRRYLSLQGKYNYQKGYFAEYLILDQLKYRGRKYNKLLKSITRNLPADFDFCEYSRVWRYDASLEHGKDFNVDVFARAVKPGDYSVIGEVKSRESKKFSKDEAIAFERKFASVKALEKIEKAAAFIFSRCGFTAGAEAYCREKGIACSESEKWLES